MHLLDAQCPHDGDPPELVVLDETCQSLAGHGRQRQRRRVQADEDAGDDLIGEAVDRDGVLLHLLNDEEMNHKQPSSAAHHIPT